MTAHDLRGPNTIFAILHGLKTTMITSQAKPSQAKPQRSACREGICLKQTIKSWSLHDGFCNQSINKQSKPFFTKTIKFN